MKVLILYGTKHGCTEKCANELAKKLEGEITVHNIKNGSVTGIDSFDKIVIGSSVYAGMIKKEVKAFCKEHQELLKSKITGYFICGMSEGEEARKQLNASFPQELLENAVAKEHFGGELILKEMGFFEKAIIKKVAKLEKDYTNILEDTINRFAKELNKA